MYKKDKVDIILNLKIEHKSGSKSENESEHKII